MERKGVEIGTFSGITLRLDYSWFIIFFLISLSFVGNVLPTLYPEMSTVTTFITGMVSSFLLFGSVVLHEFAHSLYAKRSGLEIDTITLFLFGGAAELKEEPHTPRQEFIMAAVGPLASIGIAMIFGMVAAAGIVMEYTPLIAAGSTLASINLALALFNLVPGFPLDGGRILRAVIWKFTNSLLKATEVTTTIGKIFAVVLISFGFLQLLLGVLGGLWLMLIGYFLYTAASISYQQTLAKFFLEDVPVAELMIRDQGAPLLESMASSMPDQTHDLQYSTPLAMPLQNSTDKRMVGAPFTDDERSTQGNNADQNDINVQPEDPAMKAYRLIFERGLNNIPVTKNGRVVGSLSLENVRGYLAGKQRLRSLRK